MKKSRRPTDLSTYLRLLRYLRGDGRTVAAVFVCIALESLFTVVTISSLKPVLNLLGDEPLVSRPAVAAAAQAEVTPPTPLGDDSVVLALSGAASDDKSSRLFSGRALSVSAPELILDLTRLGAPDARLWSVVFETAEERRQSGKRTTLLLASGKQPPPLLGSGPGSSLLVLDEDSPAARALQERYPPALRRNLQTAAAPRPNPVGFVDTLKARALARIYPTIDSLQKHAQTSSRAKFQVLGTMVGIMLLSAVCMVSAAFAVGYLASLLATRVLQRLRNHLFRHMVSLDLAHFTANSTGSQMSVVIQDVQAVEGAVDILFSSVFKTPVVVLVLIVAMYLISPRLTLFTFTVLPLIGVVIYALGRRVRKTSSRIQQAKGTLASFLEEAFSGMRVVKAYNMEEQETARFEQENHRLFRLSLKTTAASEIGTSATQLLSLATVGAMVLAGGYIVVVTQELRYSEFLVFVTLLTQVFRPLKGVPKTNAKLQRGLAGCDRVFAILDQKPEISDRPGAVAAPPLRSGVEFRDVVFRYRPDSQPVLDSICLTISAGQSVALVGHAGCGKSTLANLLPRFYDPTEGAVMWDGTDLRDLQVSSLRAQIALITQDVVLFDDTVAANIAYGAGDQVTQEQIEHAARLARAHDFITRMPEGYKTMIGGRGMRLSGGERQRLAIARAILKNAPVLILDEATSALDSETEALVQEALTELMRGKTVLVIAHRLSTIHNCNVIYVMEQGRFVEHGTHDELLALNGRYARFHNIQFGRTAASAV